MYYSLPSLDTHLTLRNKTKTISFREVSLMNVQMTSPNWVFFHPPRKTHKSPWTKVWRNKQLTSHRAEEHTELLHPWKWGCTSDPNCQFSTRKIQSGFKCEHVYPGWQKLLLSMVATNCCLAVFPQKLFAQPKRIQHKGPAFGIPSCDKPASQYGWHRRCKLLPCCLDWIVCRMRPSDWLCRDQF